MDLEKEDEAERLARSKRASRGRYLNRFYWALLIAIVVYAALYPIAEGVYGVGPKLIVAGVVNLSALGLFNALGVFDNHSELRYRTKQINERLTAIEKTLSNRKD